MLEKSKTINAIKQKPLQILVSLLSTGKNALHFRSKLVKSSWFSVVFSTNKMKYSFDQNRQNIERLSLLVQYWLNSTQIKRTFMPSMKNFVYELVHEFQNDFRFLGSLEIGKSQNWVETEPSAQSTFQKYSFGNSDEKLRKSKHQHFLVLRIFAWFFYLVLQILPGAIELPNLRIKTFMR